MRVTLLPRGRIARFVDHVAEGPQLAEFHVVELHLGRQDQTVADWERELTRALDLAADHLSLYQLTVEQGTAFGDRYNAGKLRDLPDEDLSADLYALTQDICGAAGMPAYEVSNHARDGAQSRHNLIYWRYIFP